MHMFYVCDSLTTAFILQRSNIHLPVGDVRHDVVFTLIERKGDFITWGVPIFVFFIQNGANFAQTLLWVPKTPPYRKNFKQIFLTSYLDPLNKGFFAHFTLFLGVRKYFFFIQNGANFAQPL